MAESSSYSSSLSFDQSPAWRKSGVWIALLAALIFHLLFMWVKIQWSAPAAPMRIDVQPIDMNKLEAIRKQWREQEQKSKGFLIDKDPKAPSEKEAPKDARYESARNVRVEKEQRAKQTNVIPKPAVAPQPAQPAEKMEALKEQSKEAPAKVLPKVKLGNLGIPMRFAPDPKKTARDARRLQAHQALQARQARQAEMGSEGGDQAIREKDLPEGAENLLNTKESVFYTFYARLYEAIGPIWQSRIRTIGYRKQVRPGEYSTVVDVVLDREGNLLQIRRMQSSGIDEFDGAVDSSWRKISRFPNPPTGLIEADGNVHTGWTFTVNVGQGMGVEYLPPERVY